MSLTMENFYQNFINLKIMLEESNGKNFRIFNTMVTRDSEYTKYYNMFHNMSLTVDNFNKSFFIESPYFVFSLDNRGERILIDVQAATNYTLKHTITHNDFDYKRDENNESLYYGGFKIFHRNIYDKTMEFISLVYLFKKAVVIREEPRFTQRKFEYRVDKNITSYKVIFDEYEENLGKSYEVIYKNEMLESYTFNYPYKNFYMDIKYSIKNPRQIFVYIDNQSYIFEIQKDNTILSPTNTIIKDCYYIMRYLKNTLL